MQKIAMSALAVLGAAALFLAALPQDAAQVRKPLKYGDRCARRVGERFYLSEPSHRLLKRPFSVEKLPINSQNDEHNNCSNPCTHAQNNPCRPQRGWCCRQAQLNPSLTEQIRDSHRGANWHQ